MTTIAESELPAAVAAAQRGCPAAFAQLYECYHGPVFGYLRRYQLTAEEREDVTHDTFERAWQALPDTAPGLYWQAWLYRIASNRALDFKRRSACLRFLTGFDAATWERLQHRAAGLSADGADVAVLAGERQTALAALLAASLASTTAHTRRVVRLRLRGLNYREAADVLNTTPSAIKSALHRFAAHVRAQTSPADRRAVLRAAA